MKDGRPVLVTGAAGKTGRAVVAALSSRGLEVRGSVREDGQERRVYDRGAGEVVTADLERRSSLERAMDGCGAVYLICPNMHPAEAELGRSAIAAASSCGVTRFVYHSVLHPATERMPHHWNKLRVEEALLESDLDWTVLQPAAYMQNLLAGWSAIVEEGVYRVPYPVESRISLVDLADVAQAAAVVLGDSGHGSATYPLVGTEPLAQGRVAATLARELGRPVRALQTPRSEVENDLTAKGLGAYARASLLAMFDYYGEFGLGGNSNVLAWLLGRRPAALSDFVRRTKDA